MLRGRSGVWLGVPNPVIDSTRLTHGSNTLNPRWHDVGGMVDLAGIQLQDTGFNLRSSRECRVWKDPLRVPNGGG